jgi:hypothetical protein
MEKYFSNRYAIVKVQIKDNKIKEFALPEIKNSWIYCRYSMWKRALKELAKSYPLPNVTFFLGLWDSYDQDSCFPLFVFAKQKQVQGEILVPDCYVIERSYLIPNGFVFKNLPPVPWKEKIGKLLWRGSTSQGLLLDQENYKTLSRVTLCQLSKQYPTLIDAGFTLYFQGADQIAELAEFRKDKLSYEELIRGKYQLWIDGNSVSYSDSGWRFLAQSVVLKPDSNNIQWYFPLLKPDVHYLPLKANLEDLLEKLLFLQNNDSVAEELADNGFTFAREHLCKEDLLRYLYCAIWEYSKLSFVK